MTHTHIHGWCRHRLFLLRALPSSSQIQLIDFFDPAVDLTPRDQYEPDVDGTPRDMEDG